MRFDSFSLLSLVLILALTALFVVQLIAKG
jgi:hypothetical protein